MNNQEIQNNLKRKIGKISDKTKDRKEKKEKKTKTLTVQIQTPPLIWSPEIYEASFPKDQLGRLSGTKVIMNDSETGFMVYFPNFLTDQEENGLLKYLNEYDGWHNEFIMMFKKSIQSPRSVTSFGDEGQTYTYAGRTEEVVGGWGDLKWLLQIVSSISNQKFNYCHANQYKDGQQSIGWHSDNEGDMVSNSIIASISAGQERDFQIRPKGKKTKITTVTLKSGSLVLMGGTMQKNWKHSIPKRKNQNGTRFNMTFRLMKKQN